MKQIDLEVLLKQIQSIGSQLADARYYADLSYSEACEAESQAAEARTSAEECTSQIDLAEATLEELRTELEELESSTQADEIAVAVTAVEETSAPTAEEDVYADID